MTLLGVAAALKAASDPSFIPRKTIFDEFSLAGRVGIVSGANRGLGLEMALAMCEAGATVYAFDLPETPGSEFTAAAEYAKRLGSTLKYVSADVTDQKGIWDKVAAVGDAEGRMDVCIAAAGIAAFGPCLEYKADDFQRVMNANANGVLYTAQAAGQQMVRFGTPGSIILIASMAGSITLQDQPVIAYQASKAAVLQMARSMACELGPKKIRVNTISPGYIPTKLNESYLIGIEGLREKWSSENPLGRLGRPEEIRGVALWLASDASTFCTGSDILVDGGHHSW
ncbi:Beta-keto acyl carrier reductase [Ceratobasidium theobromae]|uniref:Beta-keto acyl carrier reductase n=1 Tax=Ceratobasidium theobromae TaxID=1582974 RepID=A0A5N5QK90_9AGAM|nr:Beta-keto acyl carrier reductase [Ceratobasidium theobromae]